MALSNNFLFSTFLFLNLFSFKFEDETTTLNDNLNSNEQFGNRNRNMANFNSAKYSTSTTQNMAKEEIIKMGDQLNQKLNALNGTAKTNDNQQHQHHQKKGFIGTFQSLFKSSKKHSSSTTKDSRNENTTVS